MSRRVSVAALTAGLAVMPCLPGCTGAGTAASATTLGDDSGSAPMEQEGALATTATPVELGAGPTTVTLGGREVGSRLGALGSRRLHLILRGLRASHPPGVLYHVYLGLSPGTVPAGDDPRHVGVVNFYAALETTDPKRIFYSFDVTDVVRTLRAQGRLSDLLTVTFYPAGDPEPGANAVVSRVELGAE